MNSKIPDDLLSAFLDRELTAAEEALVNNHLKSSPQARQELQDYKRVSDLLHELPRLALPSEFASAVMQRAERETLIPLDAVSTPAGPQWRRPSRQAWIVTAVVAVAASIAVLVVVSRPARQNEVALSKTLDNRPFGEPKESRRFAMALANSAEPAERPPAAAAAKPSPPALVTERAASPTAVLGLGMARAFKKPAAKPNEAKAGASLLYDASAEGKGTELVLPADLKRAKVGDVIEAMEKVGDQVAVVRLTVLDQTSILGGVQSLLVREPVRPFHGEQMADGKETEGFDKREKQPARDREKTTKSGAGELVCVFIEGSREELAGVLKDVQNERRIQQAELTNTISVEKLAQYANHPVAPATAALSTQHAKTVLSLPTKTVNQILADRRRASPPAGEKQSDSGSLWDKSPDSKTQFGQAAPAQSAGLARAATRKKEAAKSKGRALVASTPRPIQVFFVLDDQSVAQSESDAAKAPPAVVLPAAPKWESRKTTHRSPVIAPRPASHAPSPAKAAD